MTIKNIILARKWLIIVVFFLLFAVFVAKAFFFPTYEAETTIMVDLKKGPTSIESEKIDPAEMVGIVRIHGDLLQSVPIIKKVVDELKLYKDVTDSPKNITETEQERLSRKAIELLRKKYLTVYSPAFTNLIQVKVRYRSPRKAALIANTIVEDYIKWSVEFKHKEARSIGRYLEKELAEAKEKLRKSEEELEQFRTENKIVALPDEIKTYYQMIPEEFRSTSQFNQEAEIKLLEMETSLNRERFKAYYQLIQATEVKILELNVELGRLRELYTDSSQQVIYIKRNIERLEKRLKMIQERVRQATSASIKKLGERKQEALKEGATSAINEDFLVKLKDIPQKEKILARLSRQVKINEEVYLFLVNEQEKARLADVKETTENITVISPALIPLKPSGVVTGLLTGFVVSLLLSVALAIFMEIGKSTP